jgi:uncharacterized protein (TIGR03437 family)
VVIYGKGMGPASIAQNQPVNNAFTMEASGTRVFVNGLPAPVIYSSATQVAAIVPYGVAGASNAQVTVDYLGAASPPFAVPITESAPSFFSLNGTGSGQAAVVNADGSVNDAAHPARVGDYISFYATGEGQTSPGGQDGAIAFTQPYPSPLLPVQVTIGGITAKPAYVGAAPTEVAGLMQVVVQVPPGVKSGGYVPVVLKVGDNSTLDGAAWISVSVN